MLHFMNIVHSTNTEFKRKVSQSVIRMKVQTEKNQLTPEVDISLTPEIYLVRIDKEVVGYTSSQFKAMDILSSFADHEVKRLSNEWTRVLRENLQDGKRIILSTQTLGRVYNGKIVPSTELDIIKGLPLRFSKQEVPPIPPPLSFSKQESLPIPIPPPPPRSPHLDYTECLNILNELRNQRAQATGGEDY